MYRSWGVTRVLCRAVWISWCMHDARGSAGACGSVLQRGRSQFGAIRNFLVVSAQEKNFPRKSGHTVPSGVQSIWTYYRNEAEEARGLNGLGPLSIPWDPLLSMLLWPLNQQINALRDAQRNIWWGLMKNLLPLPTEPPNCFLVSWCLHSQFFLHMNLAHQCGHCKLFSVDLLTQFRAGTSPCSDVPPVSL